MPIARAEFIRNTLLFLAIGVIALVGIVGMSIWLTASTQDYFEDVVAAREIRSATADLMGVLQDAETGQRGFLLTGQDAYLEPYNRAVKDFEPRLADLSAAVARDPAFAPFLQALQVPMRAKMAELARTVEFQRMGRTDAALGEVNQGQGKGLMDEVRTVFGQMLTRSETQLRAAIAAQERAGTQLFWVTLGGGAIILLVVGGAGWTIAQYTRELLAAQAEVRALNTGLEERVQERTTDLMRANEEIQRFAYIVTHDLRAPLVNIMGFTSELEATMKPIQAFVTAEGEPPAAVREEARVAVAEDLPEALGFIRSSTRKMDGLINAILKISRDGRREAKPERIDLQAMLEATAASLHHQTTAEGGEITVSAAVPPIVSDRLSLEQIFGNLFDNAIKYRSPDRPIRIAVTAKRWAGGRTSIDIADNGRGIAPQDHERVFELFRRSGVQDKPGEGIGLAHVRTLVRNLGGDITLQSTLGQGSTFKIVLPPDLAALKRSIQT